MNIIDKDQIHELVGLFYTTPYKTFYVNSVDGKSFTKPTGVFVSLGITTSLKSIEGIKDILNNYQGFSAEVVEIKSTKVSGQFLNVISKRDNISQYDMEEIPEKCFNREESLEYFPMTSIEEHKWKSLFEKIDNIIYMYITRLFPYYFIGVIKAIYNIIIFWISRNNPFFVLINNFI